MSAEPLAQAAVRAVKGEEATVFERISDGSRTFKTGDVVRVQNQQKKPATVGRILHFCVQKASCTTPSIMVDQACCTHATPTACSYGLGAACMGGDEANLPNFRSS